MGRGYAPPNSSESLHAPAHPTKASPHAMAGANNPIREMQLEAFAANANLESKMVAVQQNTDLLRGIVHAQATIRGYLLRRRLTRNEHEWITLEMLIAASERAKVLAKAMRMVHTIHDKLYPGWKTPAPRPQPPPEELTQELTAKLKDAVAEVVSVHGQWRAAEEQRAAAEEQRVAAEEQRVAAEERAAALRRELETTEKSQDAAQRQVLGLQEEVQGMGARMEAVQRQLESAQRALRVAYDQLNAPGPAHAGPDSASDAAAAQMEIERCAAALKQKEDRQLLETAALRTLAAEKEVRIQLVTHQRDAVVQEFLALKLQLAKYRACDACAAEAALELQAAAAQQRAVPASEVFSSYRKAHGPDTRTPGGGDRHRASEPCAAARLPPAMPPKGQVGLPAIPPSPRPSHTQSPRHSRGTRPRPRGPAQGS